MSACLPASDGGHPSLASLALDTVLVSILLRQLKYPRELLSKAEGWRFTPHEWVAPSVWWLMAEHTQEDHTVNQDIERNAAARLAQGFNPAKVLPSRVSPNALKTSH